jgi:hypothetical protein
MPTQPIQDQGEKVAQAIAADDGEANSITYFLLGPQAHADPGISLSTIAA